VDYHDMPVVRSIEREAAQGNQRFSAFVLAIVRSAPFQMRQADSTPEPATAGGNEGK
jgi:hypothetical protein